MIDKSICDKKFIWNTSNCKCELINHVKQESIQNMKIVTSEKKIVDKLVQGCSETLMKVK